MAEKKEVTIDLELLESNIQEVHEMTMSAVGTVLADLLNKAIYSTLEGKKIDIDGLMLTVQKCEKEPEEADEVSDNERISDKFRDLADTMNEMLKSLKED